MNSRTPERWRSERLGQLLNGRWTLAVLAELRMGDGAIKNSVMPSTGSHTKCSPTRCDEPNATGSWPATSIPVASKPQLSTI